ncbi:uncharacterized protein LOC123553908 isoform X1 [Mercenaria mercenaria]|uniref:uncharacterized protein LOC123553908 isoform X1 n=1 Tax=Mercenaria mercenaria TaxID=6596 RepID=UPI001E1DBE37|nr:uncharacterized protein LOC123553908 isoform X1 [Mercenaria mercenaria]
MAEYIDIGNNRPLMHYNRREFQCIVEVIQKHLGRDIDLIGLLISMKQLEIINKKQYSNFKRRYTESESTNSGEYLLQLLLHLSFEQLCFIFEQEGYTDITADLRFKRFTLLYKKLPQKEMPHSKRTHDYYKTLKSCIDNDSFHGNKILKLRKFIQDQDAKIVLPGNISAHDRQFAMERKSAATVLLIQQHKNNAERKTILNQAIATETNGIDNTSLEIVYHSKMALTEAQDGNVGEAEEHMAKTKDLCRITGPCFAVTAAFHDVQYTCKSLYFKSPSEEMLENVLKEGDIGIQSLNEEREDVQKLWKRIMLLFMVLSLLFITPDFVVCDMRKVKTAHKKRAEQILKEIKRCSDDIELRRQMILYLCLAALNEEKDISSSEEYAKKSLTAAENGGCFRDIEKRNIKAYLKKVQRTILMRRLGRYLILFVFGLGIYQLTENFVSNDQFYIFICKVTFTIIVFICVTPFCVTE